MSKARLHSMMGMPMAARMSVCFIMSIPCKAPRG